MLVSSFTVSSYGADVERGIGWGEIKIEDIVSTEWLEGQKLTVTLTDDDMNKDPNVAEKILFSTAYDVVFEEHPDLDPSEFLYKKLGSMPYLSSPLPSGDSLGLIYSGNASFETLPLDNYQGGDNVIVLTTPNSPIVVDSGTSILLENAFTLSEITRYDSSSKIFYFMNYDFTALNQKLSSGEITSFNITIEDDNDSVILVPSTSKLKDYLKFSSTKSTEIEIKLSDPYLDVRINFENVQQNSQWGSESIIPLALDIFRFGIDGTGQDDTDYVLEYTLRLELEETGIDTGIFTGTIAYERITSENIYMYDSGFNFSHLVTFGKDLVVPVFPRSVDEKSLRVDYFDLGIDGVYTKSSDAQGLLGYAIIPPISIVTDEDTPITIKIETDDLGDIWDGKLTTSPFIGDLEISEGNFLTFTPALNTFGNEQILSDVVENYLPGETITDKIILDVTINPVNDPPMLKIDTGNFYDFTSQSITVLADSSLMIEIDSEICRSYGTTNPTIQCSNSLIPNSLIVAEFDGDPITPIVVQQPLSGSISITNQIMTYTPNANFVGNDSFTMKFSDGTSETEIATISIEVDPNYYPDSSNTSTDQNSDTGITVCGTGTYLVDGSCKPRPDQTDTTSLMTLTSSTPKLVNTNNEYVSSPQVGNTLFINTEIENLGSNTEDFVASYRYLASSVGDWSEWTWVSSSINAGKTSDVAIPWNPTVADNYEFDIQIWDNVSDKTIITTEKLIVTVKTTTDEPSQQSSTTTTTKPRPSFVDDTKDPQSYVDRYNKEAEYKAWFDENYPDYTIHEAVGLPEPVREKVPGWIKNNAKWWSDGQIDDDTFVGGIQHLMKEKIVDIPDLPEQASEKARPSFVDDTKDPQSYVDRYNKEAEYKAWFDENYSDYTIEEAVGVTQPIPGWIKNTASWWSEGLITEEDFIKGIEYLVEKRILNVN